MVKSLILHPAIITKGTLHQGKGDLAGRICSILCCLLLFSCSVVSDSFVTLDCNLPGSSVHGISQARILEWVAISFSRRSSQPRDRTHISCLAGGFFTTELPGKPQTKPYKRLIYWQAQSKVFHYPNFTILFNNFKRRTTVSCKQQVNGY